MTEPGGFFGIFGCGRDDPRHDFEGLGGLPATQEIGSGNRVAHWLAGPLATSIGKSNGRAVIFQGAIHNRESLCQQLGLPTDIPYGQLLLQAWVRWPEDWIGRLDGPHALVYWTDQGHDLTLRCDLSGLIGLYYTRTRSGSLAFATHLNILMRLPGIQRRIAPKGLHEYLHMLDITPPNTIYEGVHAVPPGAGVRLDAHNDTIEVQLPPSPSPPIEASFAEALDELEQHLTSSIDRRLAGIARPAAFLSGGIDSSLLCALAAPKHPQLEAITVGFDLAGYDETPVAQSVARHLGMRQHVLRFKREEVLRAINVAGRGTEQPMGDPAEPVTLLAFERARQMFDGVLDGTGADEQMGSMPPRHVRMAVGYASLLPAGMRQRAATLLKRLPPLADYAPILDFEHPTEMLMRWRGFRRTEIERLCGGPVALEHTRFFQLFAQFPRHAHFARYSVLVGSMPSDRLSQSAWMTGLDVRLPFCAPQVDNFLRGLPQVYRWQEEEPKRILRALLARHVPRQLWDVPKHGFNFPLLEFLSANNYEVVRRYLLEDHWQRWQLLEPAQVAEYARRFMAGQRQLGFRIWALVVLAAWLEGHLN